MRTRLFALAVFAVAATTRQAVAAEVSGTVIRVVDGDTIVVSAKGFDTTVRLLGIDTPETKKPGTAVQCGGPEAAAEAKRLLAQGTRVRVMSDPNPKYETRDRYGRFLGIVYVRGRTGEAGSVNYQLVSRGFARVLVVNRVRPPTYAPTFQVAERSARTRNLGIWGAPCFGDTTKPDPNGAP